MHNLRLTLSLLALSTIPLTAARANAQSSGCVEGLNPQQVSCAYNGCSGSGTVLIPYGGQYNSLLVFCQTVNCCAKPVGITCTAIDGCEMAELKDPSIRGRLLELAKSSSLLISDCKGNFLPLEAAISREQEPLFNLRRPRPLLQDAR